MHSKNSEPTTGATSAAVAYLPRQDYTPVKVAIVGPFGVGKTTCVHAVTEITPMTTDERMTQAGQVVDHLEGLEAKNTTTVSMDFGRLTLTEDLVLYLFGAPGQPRFKPMARHVMTGALGGLALVDTRRLDASFESIDMLEDASLPYVAAINVFPDSPRYPEAEIRDALSLDPSTPLVEVDARQRPSAMQALIALVRHVMSNHPTEVAP